MSELDGDDVIVLGLLNVLGPLKVLGVLDVVGLLDVLGLLSELRPRPVGLVDKPEPRRRIGPPTLFRVLNPVAGGGIVTVNIDVPVDDGAVASEETDEPDDETGAQLTRGVIVGDALDGLDGLD